MFSTFVFYIVIFSIILLLAKKGEMKNNRQIFCAYLLLLLVSGLRFDIGNDYASYWSYAEMLSDVFLQRNSLVDVYNWADGRFEWGFCALVCLFSWTSNPFVWCNLVYSVIVVCTFYYVFKKYNCHYYGLLILIVCEFLFMSWDWIRQSAALCLILMALIFTQEKKPYKFLLFVVLAYLFHQSAIFLLIAYPLRYVRINKRILFVALGLSLILFWTGLLDSALGNVDIYFSLVEGYEKYDASNLALAQHLTFSTRVRTTLFVAIGCLIILLIDEEYTFYKNMIAVGLVIYMIGGNSLIFNRIAWYFLIIMFPCFGLAMKGIYGKNLKIRKFLIYAILAQSLVFSYDIITNTNVRGCVPYESVFSEDFKNQQFRIRSYK